MYEPPVSALFDCEDVGDFKTKWPNYPRRFSLESVHIPDLIRMATDPTLDQDPASIHAWRALGQLGATEAVKPLLNLLDTDDDDWIHGEIPRVMGLIGPSALPEIQAYLEDPSHNEFAHIYAIDSFENIAKHHPQQRSLCVDVVRQQLERFEKNDRTINGFLICSLCDLHAVEVSPLIEQAFNAKCVDLSILGDWGEAQVILGLKSRRDVPLRRFTSTEVFELDDKARINLRRLISGQGFASTKSSQKSSKSTKKK
jgi:hypothetical protein